MSGVLPPGHGPALPPPSRRAELIISRTLRAGVILSITIVLVGALVSFLNHPEYVSSRTELNRLTHPGAAKPQTLRSVFRGVLDLRGEAIIALGLLVLIATPVVRVAVSILTFVEEKDRTYVAITTTVLLLLLLSFVLGRA
ncbi:MAG: DUF1634 domain-containing protein [Gemmatimonadota bacterium]